LAEASDETIEADSLDLDSEEAEAPVWIFRQNGKITNAPLIQDVYKPMSLDTFDFPIITSKIVQALDNQLKLLDRSAPRRAQRVGNLTITPKQLEETIKILRTWQQTKPLTLHQFLDAHKIRGEDRHGNVQFTGYFTPIVKVDKKKVVSIFE
jgi:membrane-bound lytic murein transglycosylase A